MEKKDHLKYGSATLGVLFTANDIDDANKKWVIIITVIGPNVCKLLRCLVAPPEKLEDKSYTDLVEAMRKHHNPKVFEIMQHLKFFIQVRQQGESISTFSLGRRAVAKFCNFGTTLDTMLRDQLVRDVNDSHIQRRLLSEPDLTLKTAMQIALGMETAAKNAKALQGDGETSTAISGGVLKLTGDKTR